MNASSGRPSEPENVWADEGGREPIDAEGDALLEEHRARLGLPLRAHVRLADAYERAARATMTADARRLLWQLDKLEGRAEVDVVLGSSGMTRERSFAALLELRDLDLLVIA